MAFVIIVWAYVSVLCMYGNDYSLFVESESNGNGNTAEGCFDKKNTKNGRQKSCSGKMAKNLLHNNFHIVV